MSLFDKIKDLFTDEEEVYETKEVVTSEQEEKEDKLPTFMRNKIEKEELEEKRKELEREKEAKEIAVQIENKPSQNNLKERKSLSFDFKDEDFIENSNLTRSSKQNKNIEDKKVSESIQEVVKEPLVKPYSNKKEENRNKKFKPTPVISPVYGVLDKNYNACEVVSKDDDATAIQRASKKVDFESVRKKAYGVTNGELRDPICENCEYLKEVRVSKKIERLSEEDLIYNITPDVVEEDAVIIDTDKKDEDNVDITKKEDTSRVEEYEAKHDLPSRNKVHEDVKIVNHALNDAEASEVKFINEEDKNKKDLELTDDLFNLIDSMYKERDD